MGANNSGVDCTMRADKAVLLYSCQLDQWWSISFKKADVLRLETHSVIILYFCCKWPLVINNFKWTKKKNPKKTSKPGLFALLPLTQPPPPPHQTLSKSILFHFHLYVTCSRTHRSVSTLSYQKALHTEMFFLLQCHCILTMGELCKVGKGTYNSSYKWSTVVTRFRKWEHATHQGSALPWQLYFAHSHVPFRNDSL